MVSAYSDFTFSPVLKVGVSTACTCWSNNGSTPGTHYGWIDYGSVDWNLPNIATHWNLHKWLEQNLHKRWKFRQKYVNYLEKICILLNKIPNSPNSTSMQFDMISPNPQTYALAPKMYECKGLSHSARSGYMHRKITWRFFFFFVVAQCDGPSMYTKA